MNTLRRLFLEHVGQTSDCPLMIEVERAEGIYLYGPDGKRYIDLISGVSSATWDTATRRWWKPSAGRHGTTCT